MYMLSESIAKAMQKLSRHPIRIVADAMGYTTAERTGYSGALRKMKLGVQQESAEPDLLGAVEE